MNFGDGDDSQPPRRFSHRTSGASTPRAAGKSGSKEPSATRKWALIGVCAFFILFGIQQYFFPRDYTPRVTLDGFSRPHDGSNGGGSGLTYGIPRPPGQPITIGGAAVPPGRRLHPDGRLDGSSSSSSSTAADLDTETGHSSGVLANNDIDEEEWGGDFCAAVYEPVCGSDGQTYTNACFLRHAARALKNSQGAGTDVRAGAAVGAPALTMKHAGECASPVEAAPGPGPDGMPVRPPRQRPPTI